LVDKKKLATYQGEASHADINSALDAAVKAKLDSYQHDYNERNFLFLPAVMTTSGRTSGDRVDILEPPTKAYKQRRGTYFYYNRAAIGLACAQAIAMRIDIAPHKRPRKKHFHHVPDHHHFHIPQGHTSTSMISNIRLVDYTVGNTWEIASDFYLEHLGFCHLPF
jgi:hypothetical protein